MANNRPKPAPRPPPKPAPRPHVDCAKVKAECEKLSASGHPELAKFLLAVTGCG